MSKKLFDFCIGNPPYQNETTGDSNTATPVYNNFMDAVYEVADKAELITPARFLFNAGYTPKDWNKKMLDDEHFKVLQYYTNSAEVFSNVDIKGGVAISYRDITEDFGAILVFTPFQEVNSILHKVIKTKGFSSIKDIIVTSFAYHYTDVLYDENPCLNGRGSKGHKYDIQSNAFTVFAEVFYDDIPDDDDYIRILGREGSTRCWKYIKRRYVTSVVNLDSFKAFYAKATGAGHFGEALPEAIIGHPGDGGTVTFLSIGNFSTLKETQNCIKYTKTKFARTLLGVLKVTQDNTPGKWQYVPLQDFTASSDIDWTKSIHEIDLQLYRKYGLNKEEIDFIETNVKEMV
ncbi:Eco57I restriction-modification methylase domain-containing protein [bacterium]|nr:Eco57I restriction-modification methylase domain-containing protein [bacterium]